MSTGQLDTQISRLSSKHVFYCEVLTNDFTLAIFPNMTSIVSSFPSVTRIPSPHSKSSGSQPGVSWGTLRCWFTFEHWKWPVECTWAQWQSDNTLNGTWLHLYRWFKSCAQAVTFVSFENHCHRQVWLMTRVIYLLIYGSGLSYATASAIEPNGSWLCLRWHLLQSRKPIICCQNHSKLNTYFTGTTFSYFWRRLRDALKTGAH
jgi:hypothetical protein